MTAASEGAKPSRWLVPVVATAIVVAVVGFIALSYVLSHFVFKDDPAVAATNGASSEPMEAVVAI